MIIKRIKNILFFSLLALVIIYLLNQLGIIGFIKGLFTAVLPFFAGLFLSICFESLISKLIKKGYKRKFVTIITYLSFLLIIIVFLIIFLPELIEQMQLFIIALPTIFEKINLLLSNMNLHLDFSYIIDNLNISFDKILNYFTGSFSLVIDIGIIISSAFFISYDYEKIIDTLKNKIPLIIKEETLYFFSKYIPFFSKYIYSLVLDSIITFSISFLLFWIFKIDYALIGAIIITMTNLIPYIGPLLGIVPLVVIGYSVSEYVAIISLIIVLLVQLLESNIIQPLIFKNVIKLHPVEGILGVLIFSYLFGIFGMIFSPLLVIAFKILFIEKYQKSQVTF